MSATHSDKDIKLALRQNCRGFLKKAVEIAETTAGKKLPKKKVISRRMVPSGPGNYTSKDVDFMEFDWQRLIGRIRDSLHASPEWEHAKRSIEKYISTFNIKPAGFFQHLPDRQYLEPLLRLYLSKVSQVKYDRKTAESVISVMLGELNRPSVQIVGLVAIEDFKCSRPFRLDKELTIRPITEDELLFLGRIEMTPIKRTLQS